jgi:hypothetical protein
MTVATAQFAYNNSSNSSSVVKALPWKAGESLPKKFANNNNNMGQPEQSLNKMTLMFARRNSASSSSRQLLMNMRHLLQNNRICYNDNTTTESQQVVQQTPKQQQQQPKTKKKSVSFATMADVRIRPTVPHQDICSAWYNDADYSRFDVDRQRTVRALHAVAGDVSQLDATEFCRVGLEKTMTRRQSLQRKLRTMQHSFAVLQQQQFNAQRRLIVDHDVSIQNASEQYSKKTAADVAAMECQQYRMQAHQQQQQARQQQQKPSNNAASRHQHLTSVLDQALQIGL